MKRSAFFDYAIFSLSSYAASMLALYIAFSIGLPRPYWAMGTVYIVSQPLAGATRSKALYRLIGTLVGAAAALVLVPNLVNEPLVLSAALALWVAGCIFISMLDRSPRSYLFLLAGYGAAIIGFPAVNAPGGIWDVVVARCEEIGLGIICATAVHSIVFPRPVFMAIAGRIDAWLADADHWAADAMAGSGDPRMARERRDVAAAATEVQLLATHLPYDTTRLPEMRRLVAELRERMVLIIPTLSGIADRTAVLKADDKRLNPRLANAISDTTAWMRAGPSRVSAEPLLARLDELGVLTPQSGWRDMLGASLATRVASYVRLRLEAGELLSRMRNPSDSTPPLDNVSVRPLPSDAGAAAVGAIAAFFAIFFICCFWIGTGWTHGAIAVVVVAVFASFFAGQDDVKAASLVTVGFVCVTLPLSAVYSFYLLPSISGFPMLALTLSPALLVLGMGLAHPRLGAVVLTIIQAFNIGLALQPNFQAEFANFANTSAAELIGMMAAIGGARWLRAVSVDVAVRRILKLNWRDLAAQATGSLRPEEAQISGRLIDRIAALAPKLAEPGLPADLVAVEALRDLRAGLALLAVQDARPDAVPHVGRRIDDVVQGVGMYFSSLIRSGRSTSAPAPLRVVIDHGLQAWIDVPLDELQTRGLLGLVALRRNLFPDSPDFQPALKGEAR